MNCEGNRLRTFSSWPRNAPISGQQLSSNGFFSTGNALEVECNWCHLQIRDWEDIGNIELYHIQANPQCEFIANRQNCGNVTIGMEPNQLLNEVQFHRMEGECSSSEEKNYSALDLLLEKNRLATFVNWPNPNITPQSLAKAGFFYRNRSDEVECAWCKGVIAKWEKQDNAFEEHRKFFPGCPRVLLGPHIEIANDGVRDLGIQQITPPKNPKYTSLHTRLQTYTNWPIPDIQKPENLAQAGLYYQKVDDQVRCFHCNMGLRSWEKEDDPWFEHAKWYPMCDFVRLVKGVNFIREVQEKTRKLQKSDNPIINQSDNSISTEEAMTTEPIKLALQMGVDYNTLLNKTQQKILTSGRPYVTVEDLLKSVFDEEENTNNDLGSNNPSSFDISSSTGNEHLCSTSLTVNTKNVDEEIPENTIVVLQSKQAERKDRLLLEEENRKLKDARLCKVCLDEEVGVVYLPCGHLVTCVQCAPGVNQCPMCRTAIKGFVRTYLS